MSIFGASTKKDTLMNTITYTDILFEKKLEPNRPLPSPDMSKLADMVLEFCDQCEVWDGTPGNICEARQCRFVPLYREVWRVLKS
jgi:hypothetical protein